MRRGFSFLRPRTQTCDGEGSEEHEFPGRAADRVAGQNTNLDYENEKEMNNMKKRFWIALIALALCLTLLPAAGHAADGAVEVSNLEELQAALASVGQGEVSVKLTNNIYLDGYPIEIPPNRTATLDLNGKFISAKSECTVFKVSGTLTLKSAVFHSSVGGNIAAGKATENCRAGGIFIAEGGKVVMTDRVWMVGCSTGDLAGDVAGGVYVSEGAEFEMSGDSAQVFIYNCYGPGESVITLSNNPYAAGVLNKGTFTMSSLAFVFDNVTLNDAASVDVCNVGTFHANGGFVGSEKADHPNSITFNALAGTIQSSGNGKTKFRKEVVNLGTIAGGEYKSTVTSGGGLIKGGNFNSDKVPYKPSVEIKLGDGMHTTGGSASQTELLVKNMTAVSVVADDGYYFPANYSPTVATYAYVNETGVQVKRNSYSQYTVSGMPYAAETVTFPNATRKTVKEATPTLSGFNATGSDTGYLFNVDSGMKYSLDGNTWTNISGDNKPLSGLTKDAVIQVVRRGKETTLDSDPKEIKLSQQTKPTASFSATGKDSGTLTSVTDAMKYRVGNAEWATVPAGATSVSLTGLSKGTTIAVQTTGGESFLFSEIQTLTVEQEDTPAAVFSATGYDTGVLSGVTSGMQYSLDGTNWTNITGDSVPLASLAPCTISVRKPGGGSKLNSEVQTIALTRPNAPGVGTQSCLLGNDGKLTGTNTTMEYRASGAAMWTPVSGSEVTGLAAGGYEIRYKANGTNLASATQSVTVGTSTVQVTSSTGAVTYYDSLKAAISDAGNWGTGTYTVNLLQDAALGNDFLTIPGNPEITVDLNGKTLSASNRVFEISTSRPFTLSNSSSVQATIRSPLVFAFKGNGSADIGVSGSDSKSNINFDCQTLATSETNSNRKLAIYGGAFEGEVRSGQGQGAGSVTLYGGTYNKVKVAGTQETVADVLASGHAFQTNGAWVNFPSGNEIENVTVLPAPIASVSVAAAPASITYGAETVLTATAVLKDAAAAVTYQWYQDGVLLDGAAGSSYTARSLNATTHRFRCVATCAGYSAAAEAAVAVAKAEGSIAADPAAVQGLVYSGAPQTLITAGSSDTGEMHYSLDENSYSAALPEGTNAGEYTVWYKAVGDGNHEDTAVQSLTVSIGRANGHISIAQSSLSKTYDALPVGAPDTIEKPDDANGAVTFTYYRSTGEALSGAPKDVGDYYVVAQLAEYQNYTAAISERLAFTISPYALQNDDISLGEQNEYNGTEQDAVFDVKCTLAGSPVTLTASSDYEVKNGNSATDVGNNSLTIEGKGNYAGTATKSWSLRAKDISTVTVTVEGDYTYTGSAITPIYKVKYGDNDVAETNYTAQITNNINAGIATITLSGKGNYSGTKAVSFTVRQKNVGDSDITATANDQIAIKESCEFVDPVIKGVKDENLEGTFTYAYNSVSGKTHDNVVDMLKTKDSNATITLKYIFTPSSDNYTGTKTGSFTITVKDIEFTVNSEPATAANTLEVIKTNPVYGDDWGDIVKIKDGVTIKAMLGDDADADQSRFTIKQTGKPNAGNDQTYELVYNGILGGMTYTNKVVASESVDVARKAVATDMIENISAQTYTGSAITPTPTVKNGATTLTSGTDFNYSYSNNTDAGEATLTITGQGNYQGTASKNFTISPKSLDGAIVTLDSASLPYIGSEQTVSISSVVLDGWTQMINDSDYDILNNSDRKTNADSYTLTIQGKGNYTGTATAAWEITKIAPQISDFDVSPNLSTALTYDGNAKFVNVTTKSGVSGMGTVTAYYEGTSGTTYAKSATAPTNAGSYTVTIEVEGGTNYHSKTLLIGTLTINKAAAPTLTDRTVHHKHTLTGDQTLSVAGLVPDATNYALGTGTGTTSILSASSVDADGLVTYTLSGGAAGSTVTLPVIISSTNYADAAVNMVIVLTNRDIPTISASDISVTYTGMPVPAAAITGTASVAGTWSWKAGEAVTNVTDSGIKTVVFTPMDPVRYETIEKTLTLTITKATPTGTPSYTRITSGSKMLADALLKIGSITPTGGSITWDLSDSQPVEANTAYNWTYTPIDSANYKKLTGSITPYVVSAGGGGGVSTYTVTVKNSKKGTVTADRKTASSGATVTLTAKPDQGWTLETLTVLDANGKRVYFRAVTPGEKYIFQMPGSKVTVEATFMEDNTMLNYFVDVSTRDYYYDAVLWAAVNGITSGVDALHFAPGASCTRGQIVTFLWRAAGSPEPQTVSGFADVAADSYCAKAVAWAVERGITSGTGNGRFSPDEACTRAQAVTFLYRAAGSPAVSDYAEFDDVMTDAYYASAVAWATEQGVTEGVGSRRFAPDDTCTRGQIVTFLWRIMVK